MKKPTISGLIAPTLLLAALAVILNSPIVSATSDNPIADKETQEKSIFDRIWGLATLYKNEDNTVLQEISFTGRYQGQYYWVDGDTGKDDGWENRRLWFGLKSRFARHFSIKAQVELDTDADPIYAGLTDAYIAWNRTDEFRFTVGKIWVKYTQEGATSSIEILTFERSMLVNQVWPAPEFITGVMADGKLGGGHFLYRVGAFAGDKQKELTEFDAGFGYLGSIGL